MRLFVVLTCLLALAPAVSAQSVPAAGASAEQTYAARNKSVALAVTLEALSPIAGMGAFYAHDTDRATFLAITSALAAGAGVGAGFWLVHLDGQHATGVDRAFQDAEQGTAVTVLVTAAVVYLIVRISGLALAPQATGEFNENLRQGLGLPPSDAVIPSHALAPGPMLGFRF